MLKQSRGLSRLAGVRLELAGNALRVTGTDLDLFARAG